MRMRGDGSLESCAPVADGCPWQAVAFREDAPGCAELAIAADGIYEVIAGGGAGVRWSAAFAGGGDGYGGVHAGRTGADWSPAPAARSPVGWVYCDRSGAAHPTTAAVGKRSRTDSSPYSIVADTADV